METSNNTPYTKISLKDIVKTLASIDPIKDDILDWGNIGKESAISTIFDSLPAEKRVDVAKRVLDEFREFEDVLYDYIIYDLEKRTAKAIKEYQDKREQIIAEGVKCKKQTFSPNDVILISGSSRNTIYNHLKNGTLKGIQNDLGSWTITREALQEYLHRDDF